MPAIKTIGASGQILLGKEYAGRSVLVEQIEPGVWIIKIGEFIPESERWLHGPGIKEELDEAIAWAVKNPGCGFCLSVQIMIQHITEQVHRQSPQVSNKSLGNETQC